MPNLKLWNIRIYLIIISSEILILPIPLRNWQTKLKSNKVIDFLMQDYFLYFHQNASGALKL